MILSLPWGVSYLIAYLWNLRFVWITNEIKKYLIRY